MSGPVLLAVGAAYLYVALDLVLKNRPWMALAFVGYAVSNVGFWKDTQ